MARKSPAPPLLQATMQANRERLIRLLNDTRRKGIEEVIAYLEESTFFVARCSRHHRFSGGLALHCLEVYDLMTATAPELPADSVAIVALLHDVATAEHPAARLINGHGKKSIAVLKCLCGLYLRPLEYNAILHHMHPDAPKIARNKLAQCLCWADATSTANTP